MISQGGGTWPAWRGEGKEIFYYSATGNLMAVSVTAGGAAFQPAAPKVLFKSPSGPGTWDVTADGQRFLVSVPADAAAQAPFTIVENWMAGLKSR